MTDAALAAAVTSVLALIGILVLVRLYRDYAVDRFRQDMFALRDEVFDFAAFGGIGFRHPAYGMLRLTMNGFVRWADRLRLSQIVLFILVSPREDLQTNDSFRTTWSRALSNLDLPTQSRMNGFRERMHQILVAYLVFRSPLLVATVVVPIAVWITGVRLTNVVIAKMKERLDGLDAVAFEYGDTPSMTEALPASEHSALA